MIPFSPPRIDDKIINEIVAALKSGWITTGPRTKLFEKKLTEFTDAKAVLCVNSATAGLELLLRWFGVKEGDEVILPAYTYAATANVIVHCGAKPVFVDSNAHDFNISVEEIEKAITPRTKAIMPVDIAGLPCDYNEINALVRRVDIKSLFEPQTKEQEQLGRIMVLADAAHSLGGWYENKRTGNLTDITVFSFHAVKNLTTAEGGAVCLNLPLPFNNEEIYKYLCIKSLHGQNKDAFQKAKIGNCQYDIVEAGYKFNMTDIQAAMGLVEIDRYDNDMLIKRKSIFDKYTAAFINKKWAWLPVITNEIKETSYHVYLLRVRNIIEEQRDAIIEAIFKAEVAVNVHFIPLPMMTFYKKMGYSIDNYPVAYSNYACEISLPVYYDLTDEQTETVINVVCEAVEKVIY